MKISSHVCYSIALLMVWFCPSPTHSLHAQEAAASKATDQEQESQTQQETREERRKKRRNNRQATKPPTIYWPKDVKANAAVPTPKKFFGFEVGHRHLRHDQVAGYMQEIARVSDRVTIQQYAKTHGGRPCLMLTITSPENHARINELKRRHRQLAKPTASSEVPDISDLPVVMTMGYGVHGDEPSATNTSPLVAHYLAAAEGPEIDEILKNSVILLDPSLNPDGFDRFARWANTFRGRVPNPDSAHIEHNQGWPAGRVNYYWFDLNRDWLPAQHPESQGRLRMFHQWKPNVVLDFHEMGTDSTFFFQPGVPERKNPLTPLENVRLTEELGTFHAKALDQKGSLYFTQEVFDDFYMGKGSTYPDLHGSIGILFEQGSSRGHVQESANGIIRFSDTISNQFTASLSSLKGASALREKLLTYKHDFYQKSIRSAGDSKIKAYAFSLPGNRTRLQKFADILLRHDIKCHWLTEDTVVENRLVKAGALIVATEQPEFRFIRSLLERRKQFKESVFYDVSAWTLPLAFNIKQVGLKGTVTENLQMAKVGQRFEAMSTDVDDQTVALFMDWRDDAAVPTLQKLLARDVQVRVALRPLSVTVLEESESGAASASDQADEADEETGTVKEFGYGAISIPLGVQQNKTKRRAIRQIMKQAAQQGVRVHAVTSGLASSGIDLGSNNFPVIQAGKVAMLVGGGVSAYQAGAVWHQLDHRIGMPLSMISVDRVARTDFSKYDKLILASGRYDLDSDDWDSIRSFVRSGGTLIALSGAASLVEGQLLSLSTASGGGVSFDEAAAEDTDGEAAMPKFSEARKLAALNLVSGAIFATQIDTTHPLMFGFESDRLPVFRRSTSLLNKARPSVSNPAQYLKSPLMAGYASEKNQQKIAGTPAITVHGMGRGRVVLMIDDPTFRAFWPATSRVLMNAIYFGQFSSAR